MLYALNSTGDAAMKAIASRVKEGAATAAEIASLVAFTKENGGIEYAQDCMARFSDEAKTLIADFKNSEIKAALTAYIEYVSERTM